MKQISAEIQVQVTAKTTFSIDGVTYSFFERDVNMASTGDGTPYFFVTVKSDAGFSGVLNMDRYRNFISLRLAHGEIPLSDTTAKA